MIRDRQAYGAYLRAVADLVGLKDWRIDVKPDAPDDGDQADVLCVFGRKWGLIRLSDDFLAMSEEGQRHLVVHELVHCSFARSHGLTEDLIDEKVRDAWLRQMEYDLDDHATGIEHLLPLPSAILDGKKPRRNGK